MASWGDVYSGLRGQVVNALTGYVSPQNITIGYPATFIAQTSGQPGDITALAGSLQSSPLVMIYDRGLAKDVTRWIPRRVTSWSATEPTLSATISSAYLPSGGEITIDILSDASVNDAIGISFTKGGQSTGAVFTASGATSVYSVASALAQEINALVVADNNFLSVQNVLTDNNILYNMPLYAEVNGAVITISNMSDIALTVQLATANISTSLYEVHRVKRSTQVIVLANRPDTLNTVTEPLMQLFGELEVTYGYSLPDGTYVRLITTGDIMLWDNVLSNIARRDFVLSLEYGVNLTNTGYAVLAQQLQFDKGFVLTENLG